MVIIISVIKFHSLQNLTKTCHGGVKKEKPMTNLDLCIHGYRTDNNDRSNDNIDVNTNDDNRLILFSVQIIIINFKQYRLLCILVIYLVIYEDSKRNSRAAQAFNHAKAVTMIY